ncbi:MAG: hypothetical protein ACKO2P_04930, partial [Planctomycetota bacterium]
CAGVARFLTGAARVGRFAWLCDGAQGTLGTHVTDGPRDETGVRSWFLVVASPVRRSFPGTPWQWVARGLPSGGSAARYRGLDIPGTCCHVGRII